MHGLFAAYAPECCRAGATGACSSAWSSAAASSGGIRCWRRGEAASSTTRGSTSRGVLPTPARACASTRRAPRILRSRPRSTSMMIYATSRTCSWSLAPDLAAPGVDFALIERLALSPGIERTSVGFMGCHAALNALRLAGHIVRSEPKARVLVICLELCTLHLQETADLEQVLAFLIFADGCAAALVTGEPRGLRLGRSSTAIATEAADQITWRIGAHGFDMSLSGAVPASIGALLPGHLPDSPWLHARTGRALGGASGRPERARCGRARPQA